MPCAGVLVRVVANPGSYQLNNSPRNRISHAPSPRQSQIVQRREFYRVVASGFVHQRVIFWVFTPPELLQACELRRYPETPIALR
jgi:hypothetical protein